MSPDVVIKLGLYGLTAITCLACTWLLLRQYRQQRTGLVLWSALCFVCLSASNVIMFLDLVVLPAVDLRIYRLLTALAGMIFLLFGFIRDTP